MRLWISICMLAGGVCATEFKETPEQIAFFEKEVRPLLQATCYKCHGLEKTKAQLNLLSRVGLAKGGLQGPAINEKELSKSLLLEMLTYKDEEHSMPPDGKLDAPKIALFEKWVRMGAPYTGKEAPPKEEPVKAEFVQKVLTAEDWWAYKTLKRPSPPEVKNRAWVANPIDAFVLAKLEKENLSPVKPAGKQALMRRAYYDLTGLPPTPAEAHAFAADAAPDAYEKLIDKLLASPHYGEKWGRHWLDLVRFAETNGYERDGAKPFAWRYRDYVIRSFNDDKPYDRFIKEQIAGDELPDATSDAIIATGFYGLNVWDDEPADRKLHKYDVLDGILATTCQSILAMQVNCARCHNHKRDPILQKDYYSMLAFIQDVRENSGMLPRDINTPEQEREYQKLLDVKRLREEELLAEIKQIETSAREKSTPKPGAKSDVGNPLGSADDPLPDARKAPQKWLYTITRPNNDEWTMINYNVEGWKEGLSGFGRGSPNTQPRTKWASEDIWLRKFVELKEVPANLKLSLYYDNDCEIYFNGKLAAKFTGFVQNYEQHMLSAEALKLLERGSNLIAVHCHQFSGGQYIDVGLVVNDSTSPSADELDANLPKAQLLHLKSLKKTLDESRRQKPDAGGMKVMAVSEAGRAPTQIFIRGNPNLEGDLVTPAFPTILGDKAPEIPKPAPEAKTAGKRKILAEWLASKDNRLTARAMANRLWQYHFGRGICRSSNDFGQLGDLPTHPELLDWLATEFVARGWSLKQMHKLIMTSSAYRMSSEDNAAGLAKDANNNLFWRFDMRRLSAEEVRDSILAINGTLNEKMFGPSVFTEIPMEVLATASQPKNAWGHSAPEERTRRSVYVHVKRSMNEPILNTFDQADTDSSCPVRFTTTVPTQSLTSLNSKFFNDQAAILAQRLLKEAGPDSAAQVKLGLRLTMGREPSAKEIERGLNAIKRFIDQDKLTPEKALSNFCLIAINLNEFIYLD